jgi:hypothetical protein
VKVYKRRGPKAVRRCLWEPSRNGRVFTKWAATFFVLVAAVGAAPASLKAREKPAEPRHRDAQQVQAQPVRPVKGMHRFFDRTNLLLFAGVAAVRTLDYTSTQHFRRLGNNEVLLSNSIVDNKPLFAGIEVAGTALSIGAAWWLHRTGHHKLERWVSVVHIAVGTVGDAHNYSLGPAR